VFLQKDENVEKIEINRYLTGVVLAEMPAAFESEALKAQAVAARTYTMKADLTGGKHGAGVLCDASGCCQGYVSTEEYLAGGGTPENLEKVKAAVMETDSLVLEYEGELIEAVYFSSSGGKTESALEVWGADFPYLQSVESPGEEAANYENRSLIMDAGLFWENLGIPMPDDPEDWFSDVAYTDGGGVEHITIGGRKFSGTQLREILTLPSTVFTMSTDGTDIFITTKGYGHRVGLSQYGANAMAKAGSSSREILSHYYPGTKLAYQE
jgi:stage II sporulation protein D